MYGGGVLGPEEKVTPSKRIDLETPFLVDEV
jgi:hypothetical protein